MKHSSPAKKQEHSLLELPRLNLPEDGSRKVAYQPWFGFAFIMGLIILQLFTLGMAFMVGVFQPGSMADAAALNMPAEVNVNRTLVDSLLPTPTPTPPLQTEYSSEVIERLVMARTHSLATPQNHQNSGDSAPLPAPIELQLRGVEITQGIQVFNEPENPACNPNPDHPKFVFCNNSMPMVAGRHTLVRVYVGCANVCPANETTVRLRLLKDGQEQASLSRSLPAEKLHQLASLTITEMRLVLENSVNFEFFPPPDWLEGQISFVLEAMPTDDDSAPVQVSITKNFEVRKPLRVAYLPIAFNGTPPPEPLDADYWLLRMYPVSEVEYYRLPMPDLAWQGEVSKSEVLRKLLYSYWYYAQNHSGEQRPDQLFGWLPQELYNGGASDPFWCPDCAGLQSSRVAFGGLRPEQDIGGPRILAHEIAHNLGAQHAWSPTYREDTACFKAEGADIWVDPEWPYQDTPFIQEVGIDLYSSPPIIYPPSFYDMMAYCAQPWISPHTYRKIFESPFLKSDSHDLLALSNFQPQIESTNQGTLLVSGLVYPDGTVSQPEIIRLEGDAFDGTGAAGFAPPSLEIARQNGDDYCLDIKGEDNTVLSQRCFDTGFINLETGQPTDPSPYFFTLPGLNLGDIGKVSLSKGAIEVASLVPSQNSPQVSITYPQGGESISGQQTFSWDGFDADGDQLIYDLFYSPDEGHTWIPLAVRLTETTYTFFSGQLLPGPHTGFRVVASDGFHATVAESTSTFNVAMLEENSISLVGPAIVQPGQSFEVAVIAHNLTEPGLFGAQFEVTFDPGLVDVTELQAGPALDLVLASSIHNEAGRVSLAASRRGEVEGLTEQVTLATLTLTAKGTSGQIKLNLQQLLAGSRGGVPLSFSTIEGLSVILRD